jgi:hypothetical protein
MLGRAALRGMNFGGSSWRGEELGETDEIVGGEREGEERFDFGQAPQLDLGEAADALVPTEDLFNALADDLAGGIAGMSGDAAMDRGGAHDAMLADAAIDRDVACGSVTRRARS